MKVGGPNSASGKSPANGQSASVSALVQSTSPTPHANGNGNSRQAGVIKAGPGGESSLTLLERAGIPAKPTGALTENARSDQFARFQTDAPSCDNCGAITVRNGNCYLCHNCGNSMGCS